MKRLAARWLTVYGVAVGLCGCGGGTTDVPRGAAAVVAGRTISEATVEHWTPIEAVLAYEVFPKKPVPPGLIPDPPNFSHCIAFLREADEKKETRASPPAPVPKTPVPRFAGLKRECRERYEGVRRHIIDYLITYQWLQMEAAKKGWRVTNTDAEADVQKHIRSQFENPAAFQRYLKYTGLTMRDELLRFKNNLLSTALLKHVVEVKRSPSERYAALKRFVNGWVARTHCRRGYIVPNCAEYKGPLKPGT
jgi:hypothetical protein